MTARHGTRSRLLVVIAAFWLTATVPADASADGSAGSRGQESTQADRDAQCARDLNRVERQYVRTTRRRDADGFNALLDRDVTLILREGEIYDGKKEFAAFIDVFFADPSWTQTFTVLKKVVKGCSTAFVLYKSRFRDPDDGVNLRLVIGLSFVRRDDRWLLLHNQDSGRPVQSDQSPSTRCGGPHDS